VNRESAATAFQPGIWKVAVAHSSLAVVHTAGTFRLKVIFRLKAEATRVM
jgi:hypothetical protein